MYVRENHWPQGSGDAKSNFPTPAANRCGRIQRVVKTWWARRVVFFSSLVRVTSRFFFLFFFEVPIYFITRVMYGCISFRRHPRIALSPRRTHVYTHTQSLPRRAFVIITFFSPLFTRVISICFVNSFRRILLSWRRRFYLFFHLPPRSRLPVRMPTLYLPVPRGRTTFLAPKKK